jgi:predicted PilT family ATPase
MKGVGGGGFTFARHAMSNVQRAVQVVVCRVEIGWLLGIISTPFYLSSSDLRDHHHQNITLENQNRHGT